LLIEVSGQTVGFISDGKAVEEEFLVAGAYETSANNQYTLRNNPEELKPRPGVGF
jgi:hypothetical protein